MTIQIPRINIFQQHPHYVKESGEENVFIKKMRNEMLTKSKQSAENRCQLFEVHKNSEDTTAQ